ncbi:MAG: hypothetical protein LBP61_00965 [Desulfovibrio sp.]|nr:hypothetical protein [Desulfovibrio sp.]
MRELVLGSMPESARPDSHLPAGPWCFSGREEMFPGWDDPETGFVLPPDPFACAEEMQECARGANAEVIRLTRILAADLNQRRRVAYPEIFWETALGPWLILCLHMLAERQKRVLDLVARYGQIPLRVSLLPRGCPFSFQTSLEFMLRGVQDVAFNHYVLSRLLEAAAPGRWDLRFLPERPLHRAGEGNRPGGPAAFLAAILRRRLRALPFPRQKGFSLARSLILSLAVLKNRSSRDRTIDLAAYAGIPPDWIFPPEDLIAACLPRDLLELPLPPIPDARGRLRGMTAAASQEDGYRLFLAAWRAGGGRLFSVQHGANYGNLRSVGGSFFEYRQHAFLTWGWKEHQGYPCNAVPLPHPLAAELCAEHAEQSPDLILVGTEMSPFLYRLKSRPQAGQLLPYRRDKVRFLQALPEALLARSRYRPYFAAASGLADESYVLRALPGLALCRGDLTRRMLGCRLLVLDHYGTTLHLALAADVPTLCFWNRREWGMEEATERALDALAGAGILQPGPEEAAARAAAVWPAVAAWWASPEVRAARDLWLNSYVRLPRRGVSLIRLWEKALRGL